MASKMRRDRIERMAAEIFVRGANEQPPESVVAAAAGAFVYAEVFDRVKDNEKLRCKAEARAVELLEQLREGVDL